ncbi:MAG: methylornithine synthase PylB [Methanomassiliicoccus sp.]|nr:methylornithine synthase PylB [Methanomassiliicoccus sp.]
MYRSKGPKSFDQLGYLLQKAYEGRHLSLGELECLLSTRDPDMLTSLFKTARAVKEKNFGTSIYCYGFVYFSTHCRNDCSFCFYRRSNPSSVRYRKTDEDIIDLATALEDSGVHLVDLTMGEDPVLHNGSGYGRLIEIVQKVNDAVKVPLMISPGVLPSDIFTDLTNAGGDWFACYQETHNRRLFEQLRPEQDYDIRLLQKEWARRSGMLAEEGIMIGVGETIADRARSIQIMGDLGARQVRAMSFIPQCNTPMSSRDTAQFLEELVAIAVMRLVYPDRLIPASLDIEGISGLRSRLEAGANVITSIIPPSKGLAGVAQHELDIDGGGRTVSQIEEVLDGMGVRLGTPADYASRIEEWKLNDRSMGVVH